MSKKVPRKYEITSNFDEGRRYVHFVGQAIRCNSEGMAKRVQRALMLLDASVAEEKDGRERAERIRRDVAATMEKM